MFKKLFGKKNIVDEQEIETSAQAIGRTFDHAIEQQKAQDPLVGAKIGADELVQKLIASMQDGKGVHVDSLLAIVASLAGLPVFTERCSRPKAEGWTRVQQVSST